MDSRRQLAGMTDLKAVMPRGFMMKKIIFTAILALAPLTAAALELSLEENKGESGTVGYVDIDRVFKEYSGTLNAREDFLGEIKKKEGAVNEHKRVIYVLKADIAKLRQEREFALTLPSLLATQEQMNSAKAAAAPHQCKAPPRRLPPSKQPRQCKVPRPRASPLHPPLRL